MPGERNVDRAIRGERTVRHPERRVAALAARQYGVIARSQLHELGFSDDAIDRRLHVGRLHPLSSSAG